MISSNRQSYLDHFDREEFFRQWEPPSVTDKHKKLAVYPHYTDERFRHAKVVFGKPSDKAQYEYSDRLVEWDYNKHMAAMEKAKESSEAFQTCAFYELYLSAYYNRPVEICCILAGWNWSNGYPYQVFNFNFVD